MKKAEIILDEPSIIAQADPSIRRWGPFQFPSIERLADGRLHCRYHIEDDTAAAYGKAPGNAVSPDEGKTWEPSGLAARQGLLLPNGDRISAANMTAAVPEKSELPPKRICETLLNSGRVSCYDPDEIPARYGGYYLARRKAGTDEWVNERHDFHIPFSVRIYYHNAGGLLPYRGFSRIRLAPDATVWGLIYEYTWYEGNARMAASFVTSDDNGYHWSFRSTIFYKPDFEDRYWATRTGYTEPDIAFLPDGSLACLLRTDDSFHQGPSYICYSIDGGYTWTDPVRFDDLGVWPCFLSLKCGVTLAGYGRPGLFLRASADPAGKEWSGRTTVVPVTVSSEVLHLWGEQDTTCSYCDMMALSDDTFYLVYSDFNVPNADGAPCKTILGRRGTVRIVE
ncbi:MAG: exo-alpha-sialidase [Lachnospiraceae bacterium]|nr:exo-alpha-sialidase [Lachnospiraceae bacterium]